MLLNSRRFFLSTQALLGLTTAATIPPSKRDGSFQVECFTNQGVSYAPTALQNQQIYDFCSDGSGWWWSDVMISPVSEGTGVAPDGASKMQGVANNYTIDGSTDRFWAGLFYDHDPTGVCIGAFETTTPGEDPLSACINRFSVLTNKCQPWGGALHDLCRIYTVISQPEGQNPWPEWFPNLGEFQCRDTDTSIMTGDTSDIQGSCTCFYSMYSNIWDFFKMPDGGICDPSLIDKTALIRD